MLFPSTLVVSDRLTDIDPILKELGHDSITNNPDIYLITEYTVENIRTINNFLSISPYNHHNKIVIIPNAQLLNTESQNTLLKNLEEPGTNNYFILLTLRPNSLITTILSRCHIIKSASYGTVLNRSLPILEFPSNISASLSLSDTLPKDKAELLIFLETQISLYQQQLIKNPSPQISQIISRLVKATQMLGANIDPKSVTDFLLLS